MYEELLRYLINAWKDRIPPKDLIKRRKYFDLNVLFEKPKKIISIVGPRRAGKTYFVYQLYAELEREGAKCVYLNFEDERIPNDKVVLSDLLTVLKSEIGDEGYLLLDEIQRINEWSRWLRRVYDTTNYKILVTGSTSKISGEILPREIGGRTLSILVLPLRFSEFLKFKNLKVDYKIARFSEDKRAQLIRLLDEYLRFGGLPEVILAPDFKKLILLQDYYRTVMARDISRGKIRNIELLDAFLKLLARAKYFSLSKTYNSLRGAGYKVGKTTLAEYLSRAKESFFVYTIYPFSRSLRTQMQMPKKVYLADTGYITALVPFVDMGRLLENAVFLELLRRYWSDPRVDIYYWTDFRNEVDFVVMEGDRILELIQVSYDISNPIVREREVSSLIKVMRKHNIDEGVIVTGFQYDEIKRNELKIEVIPYWEWEIRKEPKLCI